MKLFLFLLLICFYTVTTLHAQTTQPESRKSLQFGIKAGANISNVWDEQGQDFRADPKLGFAGGMFLSIPITPTIGLQPEFLLSQKGFKGSGTLLGSSYSFARTTTHFDIPLQLQVKPANFVSIVFGPQYSYHLHQKDVYTFGTNSVGQQEAFDNDNLRKNTLGFVVGADFHFAHFVVSGRAGWDFLTNNGDGSNNTPRYKNRWSQFTIGYRI